MYPQFDSLYLGLLTMHQHPYRSHTVPTPVTKFPFPFRQVRIEDYAVAIAPNNVVHKKNEIKEAHTRTNFTVCVDVITKDVIDGPYRI